MWLRKKPRRRKSTVTKHYQAHKEIARAVIIERVHHFNRHYGYRFNRVAIKNQRRCWGSCSSLKNLNFSYKLLLLPACLRDYVVVHELCHLEEMNHGPRFWVLVAEQVPDYRERVRLLKQIERGGTGVGRLERLLSGHECAYCTEDALQQDRTVIFDEP